jgi:5'-methylthioadenosine phosphorylase
MADDETRRPIGIIGGSGLYELVQDPRPVAVETPFGDPSEPPEAGTLGGRPVVFLPRHGRDHRFPPHRVNYRANLWALRSLGVRQVVAASAVGALRADLPRGALVVPDQVIDRTWGRPHTVYDAVGPVVHVSFADPYCPRGRAAATSVRDPAMPVVDGGTMLVIQGPRFSTRAESRRNAGEGCDVVGMTGMPEAAIARELAMCLTLLAVVTDADAGVDGAEAVTHQGVLAEFGRSIDRLRGVLEGVVAALPDDDLCSCRHALDGLRLPFGLPG